MSTEELTREHIERIKVFDSSLFNTPRFPHDWMRQLCDLALRALQSEPSNVGERICERCKGSGEVKGMTRGHGPDDYEIDVNCPDCEGTGIAPSAAPSEMEDVFKFLLGEGPLEGVWWGEPNTKRDAAFWWRTPLRAALSRPATPPQSPAAGEVGRIVEEFRAMCDSFQADDEGLRLTPDTWNRLRDDLIQAAALLEQRSSGPRPDCVQITRVFLQSLECPECDGSGWHTNSGPDPQHDPCQWCEERDRFLAGELPAAPKEGGKP